jgi:hypothetical protein
LHSDTGPDYVAGNVDGQHGWSVQQGRAEVVDGIAHDGTRALKLFPADPFSQAKLSLAPGVPPAPVMLLAGGGGGDHGCAGSGGGFARTAERASDGSVGISIVGFRAIAPAGCACTDLEPVEIAFAVEEQFGVKMRDEDAPNLTCVSDVVEFVSSRIS